MPGRSTAGHFARAEAFAVSREVSGRRWIPSECFARPESVHARSTARVGRVMPVLCRSKFEQRYREISCRHRGESLRRPELVCRSRGEPQRCLDGTHRCRRRTHRQPEEPLRREAPARARCRPSIGRHFVPQSKTPPRLRTPKRLRDREARGRAAAGPVVRRASQGRGRRAQRASSSDSALLSERSRRRSEFAPRPRTEKRRGPAAGGRTVGPAAAHRRASLSPPTTQQAGEASDNPNRIDATEKPSPFSRPPPQAPAPPRPSAASTSPAPSPSPHPAARPPRPTPRRR